MILSRRVLVFVGLLLFAPLAQAHPGHLTDGGGFVAGFFHPLTGVDHVLFMLAVGGWIALRAGSAGKWLLPSIPVVQMLAATAIALPVPMAIWDAAIAVSLIAMGVLLWRVPASRFAPALSVLGVGMHAAAHWAGMPVGAGAVDYGLGMVVASLLLCAAGYLLGHALRPVAKRSARIFGITLAGGGLWMLLFG